MDGTAFTSLESDTLLLRRFSKDDLQPFLAYLNDPEVARYQTWDFYTEDAAAKIIEEQANDKPGEPGKWFTFAVELKAEGALIGHIALKLLDQKQAEIGFTFARAYQGKGLAFAATCLVLDYLFTELDLHRVIAIADCENQRSVALLKRLGMRQEGHFIQNIWFKGRWGDEYLYAVLQDEWLRKNYRIRLGRPGAWS
jgi:RimJ/RimL family protein N-acetyltransferase